MGKVVRGRKSEIRGQQADCSGQEAVSLSVISYSFFGRYLAMKCLDDFYDFYDLTI